MKTSANTTSCPLEPSPPQMKNTALGKGPEVASSGLKGRPQACSPYLLAPWRHTMSFQRISQGAVSITGVSSGAVLWASSWWACFGCSLSGQAVHRAAIPVWESEKAPEGDNGEAGGGVGETATAYTVKKTAARSWLLGSSTPSLGIVQRPGS